MTKKLGLIALVAIAACAWASQEAKAAESKESRCAAYKAAMPAVPTGFELHAFTCSVSRWPDVSFKTDRVRRDSKKLARSLVKEWIDNAIAAGRNPREENVRLSVYIALERKSPTGATQLLEQAVATYKPGSIDKIVDGL